MSRKLFSLITCLVLVLNFGVVPGAAQEEGEVPTLYAEIGFDWVDGRFWPLDNDVTLTIEEEGVIIYNDTKEVGTDQLPTYVRFDVWEDGFDLKPGQKVTLTDGATTKIHTALNIGITNVNTDLKYVEGFAPSPGPLTVTAHDPCWENVTVSADATGYWRADFTCDLNLVEFIHAEMQGGEEDGVSTGFFWSPPPPPAEPTLQVEINHDWVVGYNWPSEHSIELIINGDSKGLLVAADVPWGTEVNFNSWDTGFEYDIQPGNVVTLKDTVTDETKTHIALNIAITNVDTTTNIVEGNADPGSKVIVDAHEPCSTRIETEALENGSWTVTFDCELSAVEYIHIEQYDTGSTTAYTSYFWTPPPPPPAGPSLHVELNYDWVDGQNWPLGSPVSITIYDPDTGDLIYPLDPQYPDSQDPTADDCWADTCVQFNLGEAGFDIKPGHIVELTNGSLTKTYTVQYLEITKVNLEYNTIEGYAVAGSELSASAHDPCWVDVPVTADDDGFWIAYFNKDECDLSEAEFFSADQQGLEEGTGTSFLWQPPYLQVDTYFDYVFGWGWLPGSEVTLTIDGPDIQGTENFTLTKTVGVDTEFTPDTVQFDFHGDFYVQPGHIVTLSDGGISIVYKVEKLEVTKVDPETKTVEGTAESDEVLVTLGDPWDEKVVDVENGKWVASFDGLVSGTWGMAQVPAEYGNSTTYSWVSPMPATYNINPWWSEVTVQTGDEVILNMGWAACTPQLVSLFQKTAHIDITINGDPLYLEGDEALYWNPIEPTELDGCKIAPKSDKPSVSMWRYTLSPFEPGIYEIYVHYWLDHPVINGIDGDGDGSMDVYKGTFVENTISIVVK